MKFTNNDSNSQDHEDEGKWRVLQETFKITEPPGSQGTVTVTVSMSKSCESGFPCAKKSATISHAVNYDNGGADHRYCPPGWHCCSNSGSNLSYDDSFTTDEYADYDDDQFDPYEEELQLTTSSGDSNRLGNGCRSSKFKKRPRQKHNHKGKVRSRQWVKDEWLLPIAVIIILLVIGAAIAAVFLTLKYIKVDRFGRPSPDAAMILTVAKVCSSQVQVLQDYLYADSAPWNTGNQGVTMVQNWCRTSSCPARYKDDLCLN